jgi:hypothetical protein
MEPQKRIKWLENYHYSCYRRRHCHGNTGNNNNNDDDSVVVKQLKAELADLLEEDAKAAKLRNLPLYSCRITGWKFVCSKCYDKIYMLLQRP